MRPCIFASTGSPCFEVCHVFRREHPPHSGAEFFNPNGSDSDAAEIFHLVATVVKHEADLAFDALIKDHAELRGSDDIDFLHLCSTTFNVKSAQEFFPVYGVEWLIEGDLVFLFDFKSGVGEREGKISIVGDDEETFAFEIEPADVENAGPILWEKIKNRSATAFVICGADKASGFEKDGVDDFLGLHHGVSYFDHVACLDNGSEVFHRSAVNFYTALKNEGFNAAARA